MRATDLGNYYIYINRNKHMIRKRKQIYFAVSGGDNRTTNQIPNMTFRMSRKANVLSESKTFQARSEISRKKAFVIVHVNIEVINNYHTGREW